MVLYVFRKGSQFLTEFHLSKIDARKIMWSARHVTWCSPFLKLTRGSELGHPRFLDALFCRFWNQGERHISAQNRFSDEFKNDAVSQVVDRGGSVAQIG